MAGVPEGVVAAPASSGPSASREDLRVRCTSKRAVMEVLELCGSLVQKLGDALPAEVREPVVRDLQWTFESAVQENVSINGQTWQEASDNCVMDSDIKMLEDQFDEVIVDLTTKRKQYPRKILECVVKTIKAQHEILKQYHPVVYPLDLNCDPDPAARMGPLKLRGEAIAKEISEAMKSPEDDDRKVRRREKNRVAAQRSRKKQTQKADKLHEEYECLEQENALLRREIGKLTEELRHLSEALKAHEKMCPLLLCPVNFVPMPRPDAVAGCLPP